MSAPGTSGAEMLTGNPYCDECESHHPLGNHDPKLVIRLPTPPAQDSAGVAERLPALRGVAEAASRGPWFCAEVDRPVRGGDAWSDSGWVTEFVGYEILGLDDSQVHAPEEGFREEADAQFCAAFDPPTALTLLDLLEQQSAALAAAHILIDRMTDNREETETADWEQAAKVEASERRRAHQALAAERARAERLTDEGALAEAAERAWRDLGRLVPAQPVQVFNMLGRHMAHHLKDVVAEFDAKETAALQDPQL